MSTPSTAVPPVTLRTFVRRQWWALLGGLASIVVIGSFAAGLYVLLVFLIGGWFYGALVVQLLLARRFLRRWADRLATSRRRRLAMVAAMTGTAAVGGVVLYFGWDGLAAWFADRAINLPNAEDITWVGGVILVPAVVHLLCSGVAEWAGRHHDAKRLGLPS
ncbi:hypothetical protein GCM10027591_15970 [Zhihengliuella somnathii]